MANISIGILEDDSDQAALLQAWLEEAGYGVCVCAEGPEFIRSMQSKGFDLLLLDWNLPEMSGLEVLEWVRGNLRTRVPVLFLTTRTEERHVVRALESGADDYVSKPARQRELLARISALARRSGLTTGESDELEVGGFMFDRRRRQVSLGDEVIRLTRREFDLAWFLFQNLSKILSREYLLRHIWNMSSAVNTRTVDTHISRIRSKLNLRPENGWQLSSVYHYGYRLERLSDD
ncbi:MAG: response regulator transcription factor [Xanthomonadales bacterium]|nr:response regulator transcription factor [Xanthomonadales bacterium]